MITNRLTIMLSIKNTIKETLLRSLFIFLALVLCLSSTVSYAQTAENVGLVELDEAFKDGLMLKNARTFRNIYFTKPQTWQVLPGTKLVLKLQHSSELLPDRSHLNVFINGNLAQKIALDKSSVDLKTYEISIPTNLGNYNTIKLEVEQHYTIKCEDPLDHSLWTYIHPDTHLSFNYKIIQPKVNLSMYPFPLFDPFAYGVTNLNFAVPDINNESYLSLNALGIISSDIAQKISWHELNFSADYSNINNKLNNVIVGTPADNNALNKIKSSLQAILKDINGKTTVIGENNQPLNDDEGLIYFINNPSNKNMALLIVTGNTPEGVNKAAKYLANESLAKDLKGNKYIVKDYNPPKERPSTIAEYLHDRSLNFEELGYEDRKAERIGSPPLEYPIRVMPDMNTSKDNLSFNILYSYSPGVNVELSSLEVKFNGYPLSGVTLEDSSGETNQSLKVEVPANYVKPYNILTVQFHLFPSKFGYCVDDYIDNMWGKVLKESTVNLPSDAKIIFPNLGLFNDRFYPYTTQQDLSNTAIITSDKPSIEDYQALLNTIGAIGKATNSDGGINLITTTANGSNSEDISDRNLILIGTLDDNPALFERRNQLIFKYDNYYKFLSPRQKDEAILAYSNNQGILEQIMSDLNKNKVITAVFGKNNNSVILASTALSDKKKLVKLAGGKFYSILDDKIKEITIPAKATKKSTVSTKKAGKTSDFWPPSNTMDWVKTICIGFVILLVVLFIFKIIINTLFGRKGN